MNANNTNPHGLRKKHIEAMEKIYSPLIEELKRKYTTFEMFVHSRQRDVFVTFGLDPEEHLLFDSVLAYSNTLQDSQEYVVRSVFISKGKIHVTYKLKSMIK